jgi:transposase
MMMPTESERLLASMEPGRIIPPRSNRKEALSFSPYLYWARNLVERFFNKIKHCRRVARPKSSRHSVSQSRQPSRPIMIGKPQTVVVAGADANCPLDSPRAAALTALCS